LANGWGGPQRQWILHRLLSGRSPGLSAKEQPRSNINQKAYAEKDRAVKWNRKPETGRTIAVLMKVSRWERASSSARSEPPYSPGSLVNRRDQSQRQSRLVRIGIGTQEKVAVKMGGRWLGGARRRRCTPKKRASSLSKNSRDQNVRGEKRTVEARIHVNTFEVSDDPKGGNVPRIPCPSCKTGLTLN